MSEDTPWLSQAQLYNWMHLTGALTALPSAIETQLKRDSGLNFFEYSVLSGLSGAPGRAMKMSSLATCALGSPSRLSHAVTRLERAGWVERRNCTHSTRAVEAVLTDAGYAKVVQAAPAHAREARRLVADVLTEEEFDQLRRSLRKILRVAAPETLDLIDSSFEQQAGTEDPERPEPTAGLQQVCTDARHAELMAAGQLDPDALAQENAGRITA
ncbi:MarR family winged helix-turn-helix transcriptional regulator [Kineosporia babensis]|uniref:MarR family winged helix-turn-helix transcriptional regulator n=1 Tax=Kineosporia babensis TaxID=499548 RepID=A0A9X1SXH2_9ACTN|nr:MarR family winged helix-turn-helix transcriptional regulator [Kineosporia babensis]MCD5315881.1 MarR family winged helix-turn-helix transcriptional regulator [Kineosporia babensis]